MQNAEIASGNAVTKPATDLLALNLTYAKLFAESINGIINPTLRPDKIKISRASLLIYFIYPKSIFSTSISSSSSLSDFYEFPSFSFFISYFIIF